MSQSRINRLPPGRKFGRLLEFSLIFLILLAAGWIATQYATAPQIMLLILLYILTINFSIPTEYGYVGITPLVAIASILTVDIDGAMFAALIGVPLAELMRPLWRPLWRASSVETVSLRDRVGMSAVLLLNLGLVAVVFQPLFGEDGLLSETSSFIPGLSGAPLSAVSLAIFYLFVYLLLFALYWRLMGGSWQRFTAEAGAYLSGTALFAIPLTLFIASAEIATPAFVILCIGIGAFAIITFINWQRSTILLQRLEQLTSLNAIGSSLRESLDLDALLARLESQIADLISAERFFVALRDEDGNWELPISSVSNSLQSGENPPPFQPDDLTRWVVEKSRVLDLDPGNMHHADQHSIVLPEPQPFVWLGVPLTTAETAFGAIVLQKFENAEPFSRWSREVLLSIAGQASAAIQNARLYRETVRLYNMTDEALGQRVDQLQALLFSIAEGVLMLGRDGTVVLVNPTAARLVGFGAEQMRGQPLQLEKAAALGFTEPGLESLLEQISAEHPPLSSRHEYETTIDEQRRVLERDGVPVSAENGDLIGWLMVFHDITEQRERSEWRADLTRMIVHDLRNPITTLSSTINLIENRLPEADRGTVSDLVANAQYGTANMLEMVDSLMDINRAEAGRFVIDAEAMRITTLVDGVLQTLQPLAIQRGVTLEIHKEDDLPAVWGDEEILRRVVVNLLDNALKFTPGGGSVRTEIVALPKTETREAGCKLIITDDGPGIPEDLRERIFDRFITFNHGGGQVRGTGLGLSFCKLAVESHGGRIWVEDAPDSGSAFNVAIPGIPDF